MGAWQELIKAVGRIFDTIEKSLRNRQRSTWIGIHLLIGLDCIGLGGMTVTPFLISNHCSTVDAVSLKL